MSLRSKQTTQPTSRAGESPRRSLDAVLAIGIAKDRDDRYARYETQDTGVFWAAFINSLGGGQGGGSGLDGFKSDAKRLVYPERIFVPDYRTPDSYEFGLDGIALADRPAVYNELLYRDQNEIFYHDPPPDIGNIIQSHRILSLLKENQWSGIPTTLSTTDFDHSSLSNDPLQKHLEKIQPGVVLMSLTVQQSLFKAVGVSGINTGPQVGHTLLGIYIPEDDALYTIGKYPGKGTTPSNFASPDPLAMNAVVKGGEVKIVEAMILSSAGAEKLKSDLSGSSTESSKGIVFTSGTEPYSLWNANCLDYAQDFNLNMGYSTPLGDDLFYRNASDYGNLAVASGLGVALVAYLLRLAKKKKDGTLAKKEIDEKRHIREYMTLRSGATYP